MGIYIKDAEMPSMHETLEQGETVPYIDVRIFADGNAVMSKGEKPYYTEYSAVFVPPHGRLVDEDALKKMLDDEVARLLGKGIEYLDYRVDTLFSDFKYAVGRMPTIIEEESE